MEAIIHSDVTESLEMMMMRISCSLPEDEADTPPPPRRRVWFVRRGIGILMNAWAWRCAGALSLLATVRCLQCLNGEGRSWGFHSSTVVGPPVLHEFPKNEEKIILQYLGVMCHGSLCIAIAYVPMWVCTSHLWISASVDCKVCAPWNVQTAFILGGDYGCT